jgi:hypothetical protein
MKDDKYYESLDKRTKEYKEWKKSKGLGDTIEKITKATGVKKAVDTIFDALGKDCGCDKRKEFLNRLFPYKNPECLTDSEYQTLDTFFKKQQRVTVTTQEQKELLEIYNRVFHDKKRVSSCAPCVKTIVADLNKLYLEY